MPQQKKLSSLFRLCLFTFCLLWLQHTAALGADTKQNGSTSHTEDSLALYEDWVDASRSRHIPVRLYLPPDSLAHPVVIFSHGLGGTRDASKFLGKYWSEHGYVCIFVQHAGSDSSIWRKALAGGRSSFMTNMKAAANGQNYMLRGQDIQFVLDQLPNRNKVAGPLKARMDLTKIAMSGHSFGASTTLAMTGESFPRAVPPISFADPRIKAAVYLSAPGELRGRNAHEAYGNITVPGMFMTGTLDDSPIGLTSKDNRRVPFDSIAGANQYLITFVGGDHMIFSGERFRGKDRATDKAFHEKIEKMSTAFLDAYLKSDPSQSKWLKQEAPAYLGTAAKMEIK